MHLPAFLLATLLTAVTTLAEAPLLHWEQLPPLPNTEGYAGGFSGVSNDALLFVGGTNFIGGRPWSGGKKTWYDDIYVLTAPNQLWRHAGKLPHPLGYGPSVTTPEGLVIIGGANEDVPTDEVWLLQWNGNEIRRKALPSLPVPVALSAAILHQRSIYCAASPCDPGTDIATQKFWRLDLDHLSKGWQELPLWPGPPRTLPVIAIQDDEIFLLGGKSRASSASAKKGDSLTDAMAYHIGRNEWRSLTPIPVPASAIPSPAPVIDGKILLLGWNDGSLAKTPPGPDRPNFPATAYTYDIAKNEWHPAGELPFSQKVSPVTQWRGAWIIIGGELQPGIRTPTTWSGRPTK